MEVLYKAEDEKIFNNEYECKLHELELKNSKAYALDDCFDMIPISQWGKNTLYAIYIPKEDEAIDYYHKHYKQLEELSCKYYEQLNEIPKDYYDYIPMKSGFYINVGSIEDDYTSWEDFETYKKEIQYRFNWMKQVEKIFKNSEEEHE